MSDYKEIGTNAVPMSMVNFKNGKASLEAHEPKLPRKEHNVTDQKPSNIPVLKELRKVRIDGSQNTKNVLAEKIPKTKFGADSEENRLSNRFNSRKDRQKDLSKSANRKDTRIGDNAKWNKLVKLANKEGNKYNCDLNSPMTGLKQNMQSVAALYCGHLSSSQINRVIEANTSADLLANIPPIEEAVPEAQVPQLNNNNVGTEHRRMFNNMRIIGFCIGVVFTLATLYFWYINSLPEKIEPPRTLAQRYFYDCF